MGIITLGIVPRVLGPVQYGNYSFLTFFFPKVVKFLKFGSSSAFYTKLSSRQSEYKLIGFYLYYILLVAFLLGFGVAGIFTLNLNKFVFPDQNSTFIWIAAGLSILGFISTFIHEINDAYGLTVKMELFFILQSILATTIILVLYFTDKLNISTYFICHYIILLFVIIAGWRILHLRHVHIFRYYKLFRKELLSYINEFYTYSHPLFFNSLIVLIVGVGDRWLLQYFSGSIEQGYFGLAFKVGSVCFLFTSSFTPLFLRELSLSFIKNNREEMTRLFKKFMPLFYFIAAYFAIFISINSSFLSTIIGGEKYQGAILVVAIMAFYPIHQTFGQLNGSVFLASSQTRIIRNIGVSTGIIGLLVSFIFIGPSEYGGLNMGAIGLAIKMVIIQFIAVNVLFWFSSKFLCISFLNFFFLQILVLVILYIIGKLSTVIASTSVDNLYFQFLISGSLYSIQSLFLIYLFPTLIGRTRIEIKNYISDTCNQLFNKKSIHSK